MGLVGERVALMARKSLIIGRQIKDIRSVVVDDDEEEGEGGGGEEGASLQFNRLGGELESSVHLQLFQLDFLWQQQKRLL